MSYDDHLKELAYRSQGIAAQGIAAQYKPLTIREEIKGEIHALKDRLQKKEEMLKLLDENPAIEKFMDLSRG